MTCSKWLSNSQKSLLVRTVEICVSMNVDVVMQAWIPSLCCASTFVKAAAQKASSASSRMILQLNARQRRLIFILIGGMRTPWRIGIKTH